MLVFLYPAMLYGGLFLKNITGKKHASLKNEKRISIRSNITLILGIVEDIVLSQLDFVLTTDASELGSVATGTNPTRGNGKTQISIHKLFTTKNQTYGLKSYCNKWIKAKYIWVKCDNTIEVA